MDLGNKVYEMSKYLDNEAIARALKITPEAVQDILDGKAEIQEEAPTGGGPVIHIGSVKTAYRQKVIAVYRAKGGVGATVIAIGLASLLSKEIRVLLVDFNLAEGGGDLSWYLNLPDYPHMGASRTDLEDCVVKLEPGFHVLQAPPHVTEEKERVGQILNLAKQDYDMIIIDLPNQTDGFVAEVLGQSTTIVAVTSGLELELGRLAAALSRFQRKDIIVVANQWDLPSEAEGLFAGRTILKVEQDNTLLSVFKKCDLPREKSVFLQGVAKIRDAVFERQKKGLLQTLFGR